MKNKTEVSSLAQLSENFKLFQYIAKIHTKDVRNEMSYEMCMPFDTKIGKKQNSGQKRSIIKKPCLSLSTSHYVTWNEKNPVDDALTSEVKWYSSEP